MVFNFVFNFVFIKSNQITIRIQYNLQSYHDKNQSRMKNLIIQWVPPKITYKTLVNWLGIEYVDPNEYKKKYGKSLIETANLPQFVRDLDTKIGYQLYANEITNNNNELESDINALDYYDLDKKDLEKYKEYLEEDLNYF